MQMLCWKYLLLPSYLKIEFIFTMSAVHSIPVSEYVALQSEIMQLQERLHDLEIQLRNVEMRNYEKSINERVFIHYKGMKRIVQLKEICTIKGESNYSTIFLSNGEKLLVTRTLKNWMHHFAGNDKMKRVHKSYIVNTENIRTYKASRRELELEGGVIAYCSGAYFDK